MAKLVDLDTAVVRGLLRWRWPIVALAGAFLIAWEGVEHQPTTVLGDPHFVQEALVFGIVGPLLTGLALSLLARTGAEREQAYQRLDLEHEWSRVLASTAKWEDLTALVVGLPYRLLPVAGVWLDMWSAERGRFTTVAESWNPSVLPLASPAVRHPPHPCGACVSGRSCVSPSLLCCSYPDIAQGSELRDYYCLPLAHGSEVTGLLHMHLSQGIRPTVEQMDILASLAPAIALSLEEANPFRPTAVGAAAIDAERKRIARELHDTLGPTLGYLHLKLDQLSGDDTLTDIVEIRQELDRMRTVADQSYREVRDVVLRLHTAESNATPSDLITTLREHALPIGERGGFEIELSAQGQTRPLSAEVQQQVVRVVEEALHNTEKHAAAKRATLQLLWSEASLSIACSDDGRGFDPVVCQKNGHLGLRMMRERAEEIGGKLSITSSLGSGTKIALSVPTARVAPGAARHGEHDEDPTR